MRSNSIGLGVVIAVNCVMILIGVALAIDSNHCRNCADIPSCVCEVSHHEKDCPARLSDS